MLVSKVWTCSLTPLAPGYQKQLYLHTALGKEIVLLRSKLQSRPAELESKSMVMPLETLGMVKWRFRLTVNGRYYLLVYKGKV